MTKRQKQAQETKRRLYEAATALIQAKGFSDINIKDITDLAGVSKGTFYTHFKSKEDLILTYSRGRTNSLKRFTERSKIWILPTPWCSSSRFHLLRSKNAARRS